LQASVIDPTNVVRSAIRHAATLDGGVEGGLF
jgi:hypothetical protein